MSMNNGSGRPRFMDTFKAAMAPREPVDLDPDAPNPLPRTVKIAGGFSMFAGVVSLFVGLNAVLTRTSVVEGLVADIQSCTDQGIGLGAAVTTTDTSDLITFCRSIASAPTADQISGAQGQLLMIGIVVTAIGIGLLVGGYGLFKGARWARRLVSIVGALLLVGTMLGFFGNALLLLGGLLVLIGLAMLYVGKGATYFIRAKAQGIR
ncbi:hypothetical protein [Nakamurella deserti]|uniref:hypothetical protein n=1 Tax=Nakamurella deserti TaxID=2164074 RepID=UPI000DBE8C79|nr:hypothetical protein [Nakamurella deserti]